MNINAPARAKRNVVHIRSYIDRIRSNLPGADFTKRLYNYIRGLCRRSANLMRMWLIPIYWYERLVIAARIRLSM